MDEEDVVEEKVDKEEEEDRGSGGKDIGRGGGGRCRRGRTRGRSRPLCMSILQTCGGRDGSGLFTFLSP